MIFNYLLTAGCPDNEFLKYRHKDRCNNCRYHEYEKIRFSYIDGQRASKHDDVIKWIHFPRYWAFARGIHWSPVNSPHKGQWRGALMFSLICVWISVWVNNREAGALRRYRAHYDAIVIDRNSSIPLYHHMHWIHQIVRNHECTSQDICTRFALICVLLYLFTVRF